MSPSALPAPPACAMFHAPQQPSLMRRANFSTPDNGFTPPLFAPSFTRREFLERSGMGFGMMSLLGLAAMGALEDNARAAAVNSYSPLAPVGSWVVYGLGSENQSLPGFVALSPGGIDSQNLRAAFLPGVYQGTPVNTREMRADKLIENIQNNFTSVAEQRRQLDLLAQFNELNAQKLRKDGQLEARLQSYELAFQMQMEAVDAFDINKEPQSVRDAY
ncbi:MAG: DUF1501 domain-containing protein, partial [Verrucomicrobia bacterium]|nr:DUF1501 domain-containing protein [Verrucomicrobiota bacterium]